MALRFVELDDVAKRRIQRLVQKREPTQFGKRDVRIHLPSLPAPLRASARDLTERGVMIEAELPWLRLGSQVTTELSSDRACDGRVQWIGLDVTRSGSARLRIFVDLTEERADGTPSARRRGCPPPTTRCPSASPRSGGAPEPAALAVAVAGAGRLPRQRPALAALLLRTPPAPLLLPTAPPERRGARAARLPPTSEVPTESAAEAAAAAPSRDRPAVTAADTATPRQDHAAQAGAAPRSTPAALRRELADVLELLAPSPCGRSCRTSPSMSSTARVAHEALLERRRVLVGRGVGQLVALALLARQVAREADVGEQPLAQVRRRLARLVPASRSSATRYLSTSACSSSSTADTGRSCRARCTR